MRFSLFDLLGGDDQATFSFPKSQRQLRTIHGVLFRRGLAAWGVCVLAKGAKQTIPARPPPPPDWWASWRKPRYCLGKTAISQSHEPMGIVGQSSNLRHQLLDRLRSLDADELLIQPAVEVGEAI